MSAALPRLIQNYIDASNAHEVQSILACFADDATVHDENKPIAARSTSNVGLERQSKNMSFNSNRSAPKRATMRRSSLYKSQELFPAARSRSIITSPSPTKRSPR